MIQCGSDLRISDEGSVMAVEKKSIRSSSSIEIVRNCSLLRLIIRKNKSQQDSVL